MKKTNNDLLLSIGNSIRKHRNLIGWSQEELGSRSSLHRTYIGAVERGEKNLSLLSLNKIALALNVDLSVLINGL